MKTFGARPLMKTKWAKSRGSTIEMWLAIIIAGPVAGIFERPRHSRLQIKKATGRDKDEANQYQAPIFRGKVTVRA